MTVRRLAARDLEQVVRILREVDVGPVSPSSTTTRREQSQLKNRNKTENKRGNLNEH